METGLALMKVMEMGPPAADEWDEKMPPNGLDDEVDKGNDGQSLVALKGGLTASREPELPINFFLRMQFVSEEAAQRYVETSLLGVEERVIDGQTWLAPPPASGAPTNLLFHIVDGTTFEAGTTDYLTQPSRKLFTKRLETIWAAMPAGAIRLAADLESVSPFVEGFIQIARENGPPAAGGMLDLVPKISELKLHADFAGENIMSLTISGKDESQSEELRSGVDGLLAMAKLFGGQAVQEVGRESPEAGKMLAEILGSLAATRTGNDVLIAIARPDGFDDAMRAMIIDARARAEGVREMNNLKQVALSMHIYHDVNNKFPASGASTALGWRAMVCPYIESDCAFDFEKPYNDPANSKFADQMPEVFGKDGKLANVCRISVDGYPETFEEIADGTSNTIMLLQSPTGVPWLEPRDLTIDEAVKLVTGLKQGDSIIAAMYDGSVRRLPSGLTDEQIRPFFTYRGGEFVEVDILNQ
jgi:hypothetical protein